MTPYFWALYAIASLGLLLCLWAWLTGRPDGVAKRSDHVAEHDGRPRADKRLHAPLGPVTEWPWGQRPSHLMLAPDGVLTATGRDPEEWMREQLRQIDAGWYR